MILCIENYVFSLNSYLGRQIRNKVGLNARQYVYCDIYIDKMTSFIIWG